MNQGSPVLTEKFLEKLLRNDSEITEAEVRALISVGWDINALGVDYPCCPLSAAIANGNVHNLAVLLRCGADPFQKEDGHTLLVKASNGGSPCIPLLVAVGLKVDEMDDHGHRPLTFAVYNRDQSAVRLLLLCGANLDLKNGEGQSARDLGASWRHFSDLVPA
jgi:ankyrin repeat protein